MKGMTSSVISHSGYGIGGVYGVSENREIQSPRMQHLNFVNDPDVSNIVDANAQYLNLQVPEVEQKRMRTLISNIKDR